MQDVVRLSNYFKPKHYKISLKPDKANLTFNGDVSITGSLMPGQKTLRLHAQDLDILSAKINSHGCSYSVDVPDTELIIVLPKDMKSLDLSIEIHFKGKITRSMTGLYSCYANNGEIILSSQFESHFARQVFPCIDEPEAKAVFSLSLTTPSNSKDMVLANTPPLSSKTNNGFITTLFEDTPKMSSYLLAFVIGNLKKIEGKTKTGVIVRAWATSDQIQFTHFALDVTIKSLDFFNDYFKIPYPLPKCDIVAVPDFAAGAMENWGLITFRETAMLVDPANTSLEVKQRVALTTAHEVAHQWFGNLVTMKWWNDLWLNEGFASWIEFLAVDSFFPQWHIWTEFIVSEQDVALRQDALKNTHPIEAHIGHPNEIHALFDSISYSKGACVIHMLAQYLGKAALREGLVCYLKKYSYNNTITTDLWDCLESTSGKPVKSFMHDWVTQPGFPFIDIKPKKGGVKLEQHRFCVDGGTGDNQHLWPIPLMSPLISDPVLKIKRNSYKVSDSSHDIMLNKGQSGFYITKYWDGHYKHLGSLIKTGRLGAIDRLRLIADSLALTKAGHLSILRFLELLENYSEESNSRVWDSIAVSFGDIRRVMGDEAKELLKPLARFLSASQVTRLGWEEKLGEPYDDLQMRPMVLSLAASGDDQSIVDEAYKRFNSAKTVCDLQANLRSMILSTVSRLGSKTEFDKTLHLFRATSSPEDKVILANALTNFRGEDEYTQAIKLIRSKEVRLQDVIYWLAYGLANPAAKLTYWEWLKENWEWLKETLGSDLSYPRIPLFVARGHNDISFLRQFNKFFGSVHEPGLDRGIKQGVELIESQHAWRQRDLKDLINFLKTNYP